MPDIESYVPWMDGSMMGCRVGQIRLHRWTQCKNGEQLQQNTYLPWWSSTRRGQSQGASREFVEGGEGGRSRRCLDCEMEDWWKMEQERPALQLHVNHRNRANAKRVLGRTMPNQHVLGGRLAVSLPGSVA